MRGDTTQTMIDAMHALCGRLEGSEHVKTVQVNDWGYHGNFSVLIVPARADRHSTNRLRGIVNRELSETEAHLRRIFPPDTEYDSHYDCYLQRTVCRASGYTRSYWTVDIDYTHYDAARNSFSETDCRP